MIEQEQFLYVTKRGIVRGKSRTKQTSSDAWESMNLENRFCDPWHMVIRSYMVITETKLAIEVQPRIVAEKSPEVQRGRFYVSSANIEAHGHMWSCPGYALLTSHGKATKPRKDEFRERGGTIIEKTLTGEARIDTCKDKIAETGRVRVEKGSN